MKEPTTIIFVKVGNGRLALYHRPRIVDFSSLHEMGCTHLITLLKESEGAERYGDMAGKVGIEWFWLPIPDGKYPEGEVHEQLLDAMPRLSQLLDDGNSLLIHCSAGVHRTGMVAYALLRWRGLSSTQAMNIIHQTRKETVEGMLKKRMRWGDEHARQVKTQETTWINSAKESANH